VWKGLAQRHAWHAGDMSASPAASQAFDRMHTHVSMWKKHTVLAVLMYRLGYCDNSVREKDSRCHKQEPDSASDLLAAAPVLFTLVRTLFSYV
jgi:hypothetical protein